MEPLNNPNNKYWIVGDAIIFKPEFNSCLDDYIGIISNYPILYFSNYNDPHQALRNKNLHNDKNPSGDVCVGSLFGKLSLIFKDKNIFFQNHFNGSPLCDSFLNLTNLRELNFGTNFNYPLKNSLSKLVDLEKLTFGWNFNQSLDDSLSNLTNLRELTFGYYFNYPSNNSLSNLVNLRVLTLGYCFNQPLYNTLSNLVNLKELTFGFCFNHPLDKSLSKLTNLQKLSLGEDFNQPIDNLLSNLTNLRELTLGFYFNQQIVIPGWITNLSSIVILCALLIFCLPV